MGGCMTGFNSMQRRRRLARERVAYIEELEANLALAIEALDWVKYGGGPKGESAHMKACETLAAVSETHKLKGEKDD